MTPPWGAGVADEEIVAPAAYVKASRSFPRPFRMLAATNGTRPSTLRSPDERVVQGQNPAVWSLRRRTRRRPHRGHAARPTRAGPVRLPGPQPRPAATPRRAADSWLGGGRPGGGGQRAQRAAVQVAAQPWRRPPPGAGRARAATATGDLRRCRGGPGGRPPGRVRHRPGTVGPGLGPGRDRLPRGHPAVPPRTGGALDRPMATPAGGGPAPRAGVLRSRRPRPRRPSAGPGEERARMLTELAPYRESGHRILMEALAGRGNVAEALRAHERLRVLLRDELGVAPSPAVQAVHRRLLQSDS